MSYQRKTKDRWDIMTNWGYGWECEKVWKYCGNCFPGESADIESEDKR